MKFSKLKTGDIIKWSYTDPAGKFTGVGIIKSVIRENKSNIAIELVDPNGDWTMLTDDPEASTVTYKNLNKNDAVAYFL